MKQLAYTLVLVLGLFVHSYGQNIRTDRAEAEQQTIKGRFYQEWLMTRDPATGLVPRERLLDAARIARDRRKTSNLRSGIIPIYWHERGPSNVGGRTRSLLIDANDPTAKRVWAGSVSGGLWRTDDIDAVAPVWVNIDDYFSNLAITTLAQSPLNPNIMFFGTGEEGQYPPGGVRGMGIWRSMDGGNNWQQLPLLIAGFNAINKIVINSAGLLYVATSSGLFRSADANGNFNAAAPPVLNGNVQDVEIAIDGTVFATVTGDGIHQFRNNTWTRLSDSDFPTMDIGRIELATAPDNANVVYAAYSATSVDSCLNVFVSMDGGQNWTPRTCPAGFGQVCWYAFIMAVDPNNANRIWLGDVNLFHSADGGSTWTQAANVHVDHHAIVYRPGNSDEVVFGNDGGVYRSTNATNANPVLAPKNTGYIVTQFYSTALHPVAGSNFMLGGTQDNGTQRFTCAGICTTDEPTGADGGFCFVDQDNAKLQISSSQDRRFFLTTDSFATSTTILPEKKAALFITPSDYDDANNILYFSDGPDTLGRMIDIGVSNAPSFDRITQLRGGQISTIKVSPNTAHRILVGTTGGRVLRIDNANQPGATTVTLLDSIFNTYVSCIDIEVGNDNHMLATTSSYGRVSIFETKDGGTSWTPVEGDLPDMPVRWALFHPFDADQALIATELGVWTSDDLAGAKTEWFPTNTFGLANVRVDMLQYRSSDHLVAAASHGRGMYTTDYFNLLKTACPPSVMHSGVISSGLYLAKDFIISDGTIAAGESVVYHAGNFIQLKENFRAAPGSFFIAAIQACSMSVVEAPTLSSKAAQTSLAPTIADAPSMKCFPNPATYRMRIQLSLPVEVAYNLHVRGLDGRLVNTIVNQTGLGEQWHELDTSSYEPGIYLLLLQTAKGATTEKFVVVK